MFITNFCNSSFNSKQLEAQLFLSSDSEKIGLIRIAPLSERELTLFGKEFLPKDKQIWIVESVGISDQTERQKGFGTQLYLKAIEYVVENQDGLLAAQFYIKNGKTSPSAKQVWKRLATKNFVGLEFGFCWVKKNKNFQV